MRYLIFSISLLLSFPCFSEIEIDITEGIELLTSTVNGTNYEVQQQLTPSTFASSTPIQQTSPGLKSPYIGAFTGNQVDQTINGIRMNNSLFRSGPNQYYSWVPDAFTKSVGVSDGGNIGGTINREIGVDSSHVGGTFDSALGWIQSASYKTSKYGIGFSGTDYGNVETADGTIPHSSYNNKAAIGEYNWNDNNRSVFVFSNSGDLDRTDKWNGGYRISGLQKPTPYTWLDQSYYNFNHTMSYDKFHLTTGYQKFSEEILDGTKFINTDLNQYTVNGDYFLTNNLSLYSANTVEDITYDNGVAQSATNKNPQISNDLYTTTKQGVRWKRNGLINTTISGGAKEVQATDVLSFVDPEGSVIFDHNGYFASFDSSVNAPSYANLKQSQTTGRGKSIANPNLTEERANTFKIGYSLNGLYIDVYRKLVDNVINSKTVAKNTYMPVNFGTATVNGGTIGYTNSSLFNTLFGINTRLNVTDSSISKLTGGYEPITKVSPFTGFIRVNYNKVWSEFSYQAPDHDMSVADLDDVRTYQYAKGYKLVNIGYTDNVFKQFEYTVGINNLLDNNGRILGSSVNVPERSAVLKVRYNF
jgi:hypothetical protein